MISQKNEKGRRMKMVAFAFRVAHRQHEVFWKIPFFNACVCMCVFVVFKIQLKNFCYRRRMKEKRKHRERQRDSIILK